MKNNRKMTILGNHTIGSKEDFAQTVKVTIQLYYGRSYVVEVQRVRKNNGVELTGLVIRENHANIAPTIYLENFYEKYKVGVPMEAICNSIVQIYEENKVTESIDTLPLMNFNAVKYRVCFKVINAAYNKELLLGVPHKIFHDLAIVCHVVLPDESFGHATILVNHQYLSYWKVEQEELFAYAYKNTQRMFKPRITSMISVLKEVMEKVVDVNDCRAIQEYIDSQEKLLPVYVATNEQNLYGAAILFYQDTLKEFAAKVDSDFFILPSSVHELLFILSDKKMTVDELKAMVRGVNQDVVAIEEKLSDSVYYYHRDKDRVEMF